MTGDTVVKKISWSNGIRVCVLILFFLLLNACISLEDRKMTTTADYQLQVLGEVTTRFTSFHPLHIQIHPMIKYKAYNLLLDNAKKKYAVQYGADFLDIKNIKITYNGVSIPPDPFSIDNFAAGLAAGFLWGLASPVLLPVLILFDSQGLDVSGAVVINPNKSQKTVSVNTIAIERTIEKSAQSLVNKIPPGSIVAVLSISSSGNAGLIIDELEYRLVEIGTNFRVVERRALEQIRREQGFQMSGDVSDGSAVAIGQMLGANVVITGNITTSGRRQRLTLKVLDVKTAHIIAMTREDIR
jgi:hypothetical protein